MKERFGGAIRSARRAALWVGLAIILMGIMGPAQGLTLPAAGGSAGPLADSINVRPVKGPGGTEIWVRGNVSGGDCGFGFIDIQFVDSANVVTPLAHVPGGGISVVRNVPSSAHIGPGQVRALKSFHSRLGCESHVAATTPFSVNMEPGIFGFSPRSGPVGSSVTISGIRFIGTVAVKFNGTPSAFTVDSYSQITATVPQGATTGPIEVDVHPTTGSVLLQAISGPDFVVT